MYNYGIPAKLKAYVDHIVRARLTFKMNGGGSYAGLLSGKKATVIIASAGEYLPGAPAEGMDTLKPYLRDSRVHRSDRCRFYSIRFYVEGGQWIGGGR